MAASTDDDRHEQTANETDGDGDTPDDGDQQEQSDQGTGFVVSLLDQWTVTESSDNVEAHVSYTVTNGPKERVTIECFPSTDDDSDDDDE